jgi:cell division protein FtsB
MVFRELVRRVEDIRDWSRKRQKTLASAGICLLAVFMAYNVFTANNGIRVYLQKRAENRTLQKQIEQLRSENEQLTNRVHALRTDPQEIEKEAREQLKYAKPGEVVYITPEQPQSQKPANTTAEKK